MGATPYSVIILFVSRYKDFVFTDYFHYSYRYICVDPLTLHRLLVTMFPAVVSGLIIVL
jgi:hypothetical protein